MSKFLCFLFASILTVQSWSQVTFTDEAESLGINYMGKTFGSSWGDFDGDGYLDLFLSCHSNFNDVAQDDDMPVYYSYNESTMLFTATFLDDLPSAISGDSRTDWHGSAFFDSDRDGDLDQITMRGGTGSNVLYLNNNGVLDETNSASGSNLENIASSGRTPGILDINKDGFTDLILNASKNNNLGPPRLMTNNGDGTYDSTQYSFDWVASIFSTTNDFDGDGDIDIIRLGARPDIYETTATAVTLAANQPNAAKNVFDFLIEDLNGDLLPDIFSVRADGDPKLEASDDQTSIRSIMRVDAAETIEFRFTSLSDDVDFTIFPRSQQIQYIYVIGPMAEPIVDGELTTFTLSSDEPVILPDFNDEAGVPHFYVRYDSIDQSWVVTVIGGNTQAASVFGLEIDGTGLLVTEDNFPDARILGTELFYQEMNDSQTVWEEPIIEVDTDNFMSVVAADFDNDMDLDLYAVRTSVVFNKENVLWENVDNTSWQRHDGAWGATGDGPGIGENVTTVDYDNDGFMDLYVTNGSSIFWLASARTNLYKNEGNTNNWLKVVLEGDVSNTQGLHARAILHAGGKSQLRYQDGGMHRYSQNDTRLHFGLAQNTEIDSLEIFWPSGIYQVIYDLDINEIHTIQEDCMSFYPFANMLQSTVQTNGVLLEWDSVPGTNACQIQGGLESTNNSATVSVSGPELSSYFVPGNALTDGVYQWRVRCGCSTFSNMVGGDWSSIDTFTWGGSAKKVSTTPSQFNFYPNPVNDELIVDLQSFDSGIFTMSVVDLQGRLMESTTIDATLNKKHKINLRSLESGVYIVQISNGKTIFSEKFVKL